MIQTLIRKAAVFALPLACVAAPAARADLLRDWNLVVTGDAYVKHETEGPVRIGGNLNIAGGGTYEVKPRAGTTVANGGVGLIVGGDVYGANLNGLKIHNGSKALIGGDATAADRFNLLGGSTLKLDDASVAGVGVSDASLLQTYSDGFLGLAQTNTFAVNGDGNKGLFVVAGSSVGNAVFNVTAAEVFGDTKLGSLELDLNGRTFAPGESIVINVSGFSVNFSGQNFGGDFNTPVGTGIGNTQGVGNPNVIWNFYQATEIDMRHSNLKGSLLANNATLLNTNTIDGGVFVKQLGTSTNPFNGQDAEIHPPLYWGYVPTATAVPEPSAFAMAGVALAAGAAFAARRRRSA